MKVNNPLLEPTLVNWLREFFCRRLGHVTIGPYYKMVQAHCSRCGIKNKGIADEDSKDWVLPW